jgi:hypothetical protein
MVLSAILTFAAELWEKLIFATELWQLHHFSFAELWQLQDSLAELCQLLRFFSICGIVGKCCGIVSDPGLLLNLTPSTS